jgi:hypothetical protein
MKDLMYSLGLLTAALFCSSPIAAQQSKASLSFDFQGRYLVSVSDADMVASAYSDGKLGAAEGTDALSIIRLDRLPQKLKAVEIGVSNSVTGPPSSVTVTPDGRYAIVIETRGSLPKGKSNVQLKDLEVGKMITVVDLSDPDNPTVIQKIEGVKGFKSPQSVSINSSGTLVAISFRPEDSGRQMPLVIYPFQQGKLLSPIIPLIPEWNKGDELTGAEFHPTEDILALLNSSKPELSFVRVVRNDGEVKLVRWGNAVQIDMAPYKVIFTPDGRHALTNAIYADGSTGDFAPTGTVSVIRLTIATNENGIPTHQVVSRTNTSVLPEGMAISPDGRWVVTANLERSWPALDDPRQGFFSSMSLLSLDPTTGFIKHVRDVAMDGILPEAVVFDNSSKYIAVTIFDQYDETWIGGSIDFWRISKDFHDPDRTELVKTNYSVPVTRGAHSLVIVR